MKKIFGSDSRLFSIMTMLLELAEINVLFIICSLPVVTMGASFVAMYESLYQMQKYGEGSFSAKQFFKTYKRSMKKSIPIWCICLIAMILLLGNLRYTMGTMDGTVRFIILGIYIVFLIVFSGMVQFQCFILAMTEKWNKDYIKDAFLLSVAKFPYVILTTIVTTSPVVMLMMPVAMLLRMLPLILLYWIACPGYICVSVYTKILEPLYPEWFCES